MLGQIQQATVATRKTPPAADLPLFSPLWEWRFRGGESDRLAGAEVEMASPTGHGQAAKGEGNRQRDTGPSCQSLSDTTMCSSAQSCSGSNRRPKGSAGRAGARSTMTDRQDRPGRPRRCSDRQMSIAWGRGWRLLVADAAVHASSQSERPSTVTTNVTARPCGAAVGHCQALQLQVQSPRPPEAQAQGHGTGHRTQPSAHCLQPRDWLACGGAAAQARAVWLRRRLRSAGIPPPHL